MTKDTAYATATAGTYTLQSVNEYGSLGETATFEVTEAMTTGIKSVVGAQSIVNGSNVIYNLAGQRVAQPVKGLYIINGKKIMIQ